MPASPIGHLRQAIVTLADSSRHHNPWAKALYVQARGRRHDHPRAIRTVGRAWCGILWRLWQDRTPYDPARHRALQQHVTVIIPTPSGPIVDHPAAERMLATTVADCREQEMTAAPYPSLATPALRLHPGRPASTVN